MYPKDAITITGVVSPTGETLNLSGEENTILQANYSIWDKVSGVTAEDYQGYITCTDSILAPIWWHNDHDLFSSQTVNSFEGSAECNDTVFLENTSASDSMHYQITYLPYSISDPAYSFIGSVSYGDWMLTMAVGIFLLSFLAWGYLWSPFKPKNKYAIT